MHKRVSIAAAALGFAVLSCLLVLGAERAEAQTLIKVNLYRGGSGTGPAFGWPRNNVLVTLTPKTWPPGCNIKQIPPPAPGVCPNVPYYGRHPKGPIATGANVTALGAFSFNANKFDSNAIATVLGIPGFPVLINKYASNYGVANFGPGQGIGVPGAETFAATGFDPQTLGTQDFVYDPVGSPGGVLPFHYPPQATSTGTLQALPAHGGRFEYGAQGPGARFGGTIGVVGVNNVYLVLTFNPGVATTYHYPAALTPGTPIPAVTTGLGSVPGATMIHRKKMVEPQKVRQNLGFTPGGFVSLGATLSTAYTFGIREAGPWTTAMVRVTEMSRPGVFPTTTLRTDTGMYNLNLVAKTGTIQLVQPFIFRSMSPNGNNGRSFTNRAKITFLPEPGLMTMAGFGLGGLLVLERIKRRRAAH